MELIVTTPVASGCISDPAWLARFAAEVEHRGFDGIAVPEHTVIARGTGSTYPYAASGDMGLSEGTAFPDPLTALAFLAATTRRLSLGTAVLVLPNHHPVALAKRLATLDALSNGRVQLSVGLGWMREEVEACGAPFTARGRYAEEQVRVLRALWTHGPAGASFEGEFFAFERLMCHPQPVRPGGIPIHLGGHSPAAARRAGRIGDGFQPLGVVGAKLQDLVRLMRSEADRSGRDPDELALTLAHLVDRITPEHLAKFAALGATRVVLTPSPEPDVEAVCAELADCADRLGLTPVSDLTPPAQ